MADLNFDPSSIDASNEVFAIQETTIKRTSNLIAWPIETERMKLQLDDINFTADTGSIIKVIIEMSWDGGRTFTSKDENIWEAGAKSARDGSSPCVIIGPYRAFDKINAQGKINNPTHVLIHMEPLKNAPDIGLKTNL